MTIDHEVRDNHLIKQGRNRSKEFGVARKAIELGGGHDKIAQTETRTQDLAEGASVEDAISFIQALESGERVAAIAELAVVIVLDDPCARVGSPCQQFEPTGKRERDPQWTLVRWRNNCEAPLRRALNGKTSIEAVTVNRDWDNRCAGFCKRLASTEIAGILEPDGISPCQQGFA